MADAVRSGEVLHQKVDGIDWYLKRTMRCGKDFYYYFSYNYYYGYDYYTTTIATIATTSTLLRLLLLLLLRRRLLLHPVLLLWLMLLLRVLLRVGVLVESVVESVAESVAESGFENIDISKLKFEDCKLEGTLGIVRVNRDGGRRRGSTEWLRRGMRRSTAGEDEDRAKSKQLAYVGGEQ